MRVALNAEVIRSLQQFFGSFEQPNYHEVERKYRKQPYREPIAHLRERLRVTETTDLNDDVCVALCLESEEACFAVMLSLVGPYVVLARVRDGKWSFLSMASHLATDEEQFIWDVLSDAGLSIVPEPLARQTISFQLVNAESSTCTVYEALFSETGIPW